MPLALALSAFLFVTAASPPPRKFNATTDQESGTNCRFRTIATQNGDLLNEAVVCSAAVVASDRTVRRGVPAPLSSLAAPALPTIGTAGPAIGATPPTGAPGEPGPTNDVTIDSGGNDLVTLDTNATVSSLMLGGPATAPLQVRDGGEARTLTITNGLTVGQPGVLSLSLRQTRSPRARTRGNLGYRISLSNGSSLTVNGSAQQQRQFRPWRWFDGEQSPET